MTLERTAQRTSQRQARKKRWYPFRVLAVFFGMIALILAVIVPNLSVQRDAEAKQLQEASDAYWTAQSENNRLSQQVAESSTQDFVERVARRDFGYCVYGETVYTVSNLDEILAAEEEESSRGTQSPDVRQADAGSTDETKDASNLTENDQ